MYMNLFFHHRLLLLCMTISQWFQNIFEVAYLVKWQDTTSERFWLRMILAPLCISSKNV